VHAPLGALPRCLQDVLSSGLIKGCPFHGFARVLTSTKINAKVPTLVPGFVIASLSGSFVAVVSGRATRLLFM
jgi:hypothetical protein